MWARITRLSSIKDCFDNSNSITQVSDRYPGGYAGRASYLSGAKGMIIRPVEPDDKAEWLRIRLELWPDSPEKEAEEIDRFLAGYPLPTLMAAFVCTRPESGLCGLAEVAIHESAPGCVTDRIGYLEAWYVDPDWRGQGVGRALVERVEEWARAAGCREMASDTEPAYPLSPAAHAALGYEEVARFFRKDLS